MVYLQNPGCWLILYYAFYISGLFSGPVDALEEMSVVRDQSVLIDMDRDCAAEILEEPLHGSLSLRSDGALTYQAAEGICDEVDAMTLLGCRNGQHDTLHLRIEILCEPLLIYSGFSPNGDGINDVFTIKGIENYPDNDLSIYDYSGKEIYRKKGYRNNWSGRTNTGEPLSDIYTYYYVLDDGKGNYHSGYFKIDS